MSHDVLCTLQDSTVLVCSGHVVNGSAASVLISDDGISGKCQHPWSPAGEFGTETSQHPWSTMESLMKVDTLMEFHEELVRVDLLRVP